VKTGAKRTASKTTGKGGGAGAAKAKTSSPKPRKAKASPKKVTARKVTGKRRSAKATSTRAAKKQVKKAETSKVRKAEKAPQARTSKSVGVSGGQPVAGKSSAAAADGSTTPRMVLPFPERGRSTRKTRLTAKQLREFKQLLLQKRAELAGDVTHLADEVVNRTGRGPNEHTSMPIHMADVGSDNWEKEFTLGLIASEHALIREIDEALARISNRTYGVCLATHKNISVARLRAKPWAKYCIEYARARDEGRAL
jgi:DnaK suppressor protein